MKSYPIMKPPFEVVDFSEMTKKQAKDHFDWFIHEVPVRINVLKSEIKESGFENIQEFNTSPSSLAILWDWAKNRIKIIPKAQNELKIE